jgi:hypothetical protein
MNPLKAQRTWNSLSTKWLMGGTSFGRGRPLRNSRRKQLSHRKIKKGNLTNLIPVEVINAITGEVAKGYMRDLSVRKLRKWLELHNYRAQVEQVSVPKRSTFYKMNVDDFTDFPILIKLGTYQVPYLIDYAAKHSIVNGRWTAEFNLKTVDNLKYLEIVASKKETIMKRFNKIKKTKKK